MELLRPVSIDTHIGATEIIVGVGRGDFARPLRFTRRRDATESAGARLFASLERGHAHNAWAGTAAARCRPVPPHRNIAMISCVVDCPVWEAIIQPERISCRRRLQDTTNKLQST
jgi:hypothetical protein